MKDYPGFLSREQKERNYTYFVHVLKGTDTQGFMKTPFPRYPETHISFPFDSLGSAIKALKLIAKAKP